MPEDSTHILRTDGRWEEPNPLSMFDLTGRTAIVTGASSGLGERFARTLHAAGANVVAVARRAERLDALAARYERISTFPLDVTDDEGIKRLIAETVANFGGIDIVVNNAGLGVSQPAIDEDLDAFRHTIDVNLTSVFNLARQAARHMIDVGRGSIINIASVYGLGSSWPIPNGAYTASKGGVIQLTRELGSHWAKHGVRVNALVPGFFLTEATAGMEDNPKSIEYVRKGSPIRRFGYDYELDGALVYLASDASTYMTGQSLVVDGGWTAH